MANEPHKLIQSQDALIRKACGTNGSLQHVVWVGDDLNSDSHDSSSDEREISDCSSMGKQVSDGCSVEGNVFDTVDVSEGVYSDTSDSEAKSDDSLSFVNAAPRISASKFHSGSTCCISDVDPTYLSQDQDLVMDSTKGVGAPSGRSITDADATRQSVSMHRWIADVAKKREAIGSRASQTALKYDLNVGSAARLPAQWPLRDFVNSRPARQLKMSSNIDAPAPSVKEKSNVDAPANAVKEEISPEESEASIRLRLGLPEQAVFSRHGSEGTSFHASCDKVAVSALSMVSMESISTLSSLSMGSLPPLSCPQHAGGSASGAVKSMEALPALQEVGSV